MRNYSFNTDTVYLLREAATQSETISTEEIVYISVSSLFLACVLSNLTLQTWWLSTREQTRKGGYTHSSPVRRPSPRGG